MFNHAPAAYECSVCKVVAGEIGDNAVVAENEHALAIVSRRVWATGPGHVLVEVAGGVVATVAFGDTRATCVT